MRIEFGHTLRSTFAVLAILGAWQSAADEAATRYPRMAPIDQYLMDRNAEIALARSAAPQSISADATVLVLARNGYETAVRGRNGFVCMVERGWVGALDSPEMWNPKIRGADCLNPPAARSILPLAMLRTKMLLEGRSRTEVIARMREELGSGRLPSLEPGAMSYMMAKGSYLTDAGGHNGPHLMFFMPLAGAAWGADLPGSPVASSAYWFGFGKEPASREANGLPPVRVFVVAVRNWSDGTAAPRHVH
jgi:hypothetical protein